MIGSRPAPLDFVPATASITLIGAELEKLRSGRVPSSNATLRSNVETSASSSILSNSSVNKKKDTRGCLLGLKLNWQRASCAGEILRTGSIRVNGTQVTRRVLCETYSACTSFRPSSKGRGTAHARLREISSWSIGKKKRRSHHIDMSIVSRTPIQRPTTRFASEDQAQDADQNPTVG